MNFPQSVYLRELAIRVTPIECTHLCETFDILVSPTGAFQLETPATKTVSPVDETTCKQRANSVC